jgi:serine/threonine protein kinase
MEYVDGISVSMMIKSHKRLSLARTIAILKHTAMGLEAALKIGIVHRDVKPGNILVGKDGVAKLVDLGLATKLKRSDGSDNQNLAAVEGTAGYMAPEQMTDGVLADHRADIYSLGVTFYHMITGTLPYIGSTRDEVMMKHRNGIATPPHQFVTGLPEAVGQAILKMMEKDPAKRPQNYEEILQLLGEIEKKFVVATG